MNQANKTIKKRSVSLLVVFCIFFVAITARLAYIQFSWGDELQDKAIGQWTREIGVYPKRGTIYDTNGLVLAVSVTRYSLQATPNDINDAEAVAMLLSPILDMSTDEIAQKLNNKSQAIVWIKRLLSDDQAQQIKNLGIKGLDLVDEPARVYPYNNLAAQVLGFTMKYADSNGHSGQEGLELYYNSYLIGEPGTILRETDNTGKEIPYGSEIYVEAQNGSNIVLTIDATLQSYLQEIAQEWLQKYQADGVYAVATNPNTGEVYAMVNLPDYDPNEPPRNLTLDEMQVLTKNMTCLMNYDPGSTFKPFILAAAIEEGLATMDDEFYCPGYRVIDGVTIHCWKRAGHGGQTTQTGLNTSCNPVFMDLGERLGKDLVYDYISKFGFGQKTGIDIAGEESGILIKKENATHTDWLTMCFGQAIAVTPIQMITAFNSLINGGYMMQPYLLKSVNRTIENNDGTKSIETLYDASPTPKEQVISEQTSDILREALKNTVINGSGKGAAVNGYVIGGKTGTSQTYDENGNIALGVNIASFIGFGPYEDPQISVYFVVNKPKTGDSSGSTVAAPAVSKFLTKAFPYLGIEPTEPLKNSVFTPDVTGLEVEDAVILLESKQFDVILEGSGNIVELQSIAASTWAPLNTVITLKLTQRAIDTSLIKVPDIEGMSILEANRILFIKGLKLNIMGDGQYATDQSILPGTYVPAGTEITGYFTDGPG